MQYMEVVLKVRKYNIYNMHKNKKCSKKWLKYIIRHDTICYINKQSKIESVGGLNNV